MIFAGILAGGTGSRMENATMPKQFLEVNGIPILIRTLKTFLSVDTIDYIIISTNVDWSYKYSELIDRYCLDKSRIILTPGGASRLYIFSILLVIRPLVLRLLQFCRT